MSGTPYPLVTGNNGLRGQLETSLSDLDSQDKVIIRLDNGRAITVPASLLASRSDDSFYLPYSLEELDDAVRSDTLPTAQTVVIPIVAEELRVAKRFVETGTVRIHKTVVEHAEVVDEPLLREKVTVETVPINRVVEGETPAVRYEGETMIIPVLEEVLVVEKRLVLKEELHIRREQQTYHEPQTVTLRTEEVQVTRIEPEGTASS